MNIIIVNNDRITRIELRGVLEKWGYEVMEAANKAEAWRFMTEDPTAPHILIIDWLMPEIDGEELCRRIDARQDNHLTYTIMLTGKTDLEDIVGGLKSNACDDLTKRVKPPELKSRLEVGKRILNYEERIRQYSEKMESLAEKPLQT